MHYSGDFGDDGWFDGNGVATYPDGSVYTGEWSNGQRHGYGTYTTADTEYTGQWQQDSIEGNGILTWHTHYYDHPMVEEYVGVWHDTTFMGTVLFTPEQTVNDDTWEFKGLYTKQSPWDVMGDRLYGRGIVCSTNNQHYAIYIGEVTEHAVYNGMGMEIVEGEPQCDTVWRGIWDDGELAVDAEVLYKAFTEANGVEKQALAKRLYDFRLPSVYLDGIGTLYDTKALNILPEIDVLYSPTHFLANHLYNSEKERSLVNEYYQGM